MTTQDDAAAWPCSLESLRRLDFLSDNLGADRQILRKVHATMLAAGYSDAVALGYVESFCHYAQADAGPREFPSLDGLMVQESSPQPDRSFKSGLRRLWWER